MVNVVKTPFDVGIYNPLFPVTGSGGVVDSCDGLMASPSRSESVATTLEFGFPNWFECILDLGLKTAVNDSWDSQGSEFATGFWYVHPSGWFGSPGLKGGQLIHHFSSGCWCFYYQFVNASRVFALIHLRNSSHT